ncbi:MAG: hypothetical protein JNK15_11445, partial [Planctomycetes bacterium]|nr:hypothetical protein [Planctomycetota bacterium]
GGTWQVQPWLGRAGHGANHDTPVPLQASTNYWVVWRDGGGNKLPYEPGGSTMPYARFTGGNWVLQASAQAFKWRGYCSQLDAATVQPIGLGCATSANLVPAAFTNHVPQIGNANFQIEATGFPSGSIGLCVLGTDPTWVSLPIPGAPATCFLHSDLVATATVLTGTGNEQAVHSTGAAGHCWLDFPIPANPAIVGYLFNSQFAVLDLALPDPLPFVFTNGLRFTLL